MLKTYLKQIDIGLQIDKYKVLEKLGRGSFATVYKIQNIQNKKLLALKLLNQSEKNNNELKAYKTLSSDYLLKQEDEIFSYVIFDCLLTEYCQEGDLALRIKETKENFDFKIIIVWISDVLNGISYLHDNNVIHRDIKPGNLLIKNDRIKIADFGDCVFTNNEDFVLNSQVGTKEYWSPELECGKKHGFKTDIWSTGCVLFELVSLKRYKEYLNKSDNENQALNLPIVLVKLLKMSLVSNIDQRSNSKDLLRIVNKEDKEALTFVYLNEFISRDDLPESFFPQIISTNINQRNLLIKEIDLSFQSNQIVTLKSADHIKGKSIASIQYAKHFSSASDYNFVYWIKSDAHNYQLKQFASTTLQIKSLNMRILLKRILNEIKCRCLNAKTRVIFIFDDCDERFESYLKKIPQNIYILLIAKQPKTNKSFNTIELTPFESNDTVLIIDRIIYSNEWNILKLSAFLDSDFISFETLELFLDSNKLKEQVKELNSQFLIVIKQKSLLGFKINQRMQNLLKEYLLTHCQNDFKQIVEKIGDSIHYLLNKNCSYFTINAIFENLFLFTTNSKDKAKFLAQYGDIMVNLEIYEKAIECFEKSNEYFSDGNCLFKIGKTLTLLNQNESAIQCYLKLLNTNHCSISQIKVQYEIGLSFYKIGKFDEALEYLKVSSNLAIQLDGEESESLGVIFISIGNVYNKKSEYKKAEDSFKKLDSKDNHLIAQCLNGIGLVHFNSCSYIKAIEYLEKSLNIYKEINDQNELKINLKTIGSAYCKLGKYKKCLEYYEQSFRLNNNLNNLDEMKAIDLHDIGQVNRNLGKYKKATDYYKESLMLFKALYDEKEASSPNDANTLQNAGLIYENLGKFVKALDCYEKSYECYKKNFIK